MRKIIKRFSNINSSPWNRSEHMRSLHKEGRYLGTSRIGEWNRSQEKRDRMSNYRSLNSLNKNSHGYGSEIHMRQANRTLLSNKFQGEKGYLYFLKFPASIKVGFSKDWERRTTKQILGGTVIAIISGPTRDLADLEYDTFVEFQKYTKLNETKTRYTEFLDLRVRKKVYEFLKNRVKENKKLRFEIQNNLI
jgi:hypothetical protein